MPPDPSALRTTGLTRRSFIAAGVVGVALTGCSADAPTGPDEPTAPAELAPDVAVASTALEQIRTVLAAVVATQARFPAARNQLGAVEAMHRAHEKSLVDAVPERARASASPAPYVVPPRREVALSRLSADEQQLHVRLDGLAVRAESGDFALQLAAMGAGVAQQLARWPGGGR